MSQNYLTEPIQPDSMKPLASLPASAKWLPMMARNACPTSREIGAQLSRNTQLAAFTRGIIADRAAVAAAIASPWSNGQTEGQITKLKLVKRQIYGRANLDLLRARLVGTA